MKILLFLTAAVLLNAPPVFSQEEAAPSTAPSPAVPAAPSDQRLELIPSNTPQLAPDPLPLMPDAPASAQKPKKRNPALPTPIDPAQDPDKKTKTRIAEDELRGRIRFREAKTKAIKDPAIQSEWDRAHAAKTDAVKREAMRSYYKMLFARMVKIDKSIKPRIDAALIQSLNRLDQNRIKMSEALDPQDRLASGETE